MTTQQTHAEGWQLTGSSPNAYEHDLVPRMITPWVDRLVEQVALQRGEHVLDKALRAHGDDEGVIFPMQTYLAVAHQ